MHAAKRKSYDVRRTVLMAMLVLARVYARGCWGNLQWVNVATWPMHSLHSEQDDVIYILCNRNRRLDFQTYVHEWNPNICICRRRVNANMTDLFWKRYFRIILCFQVKTDWAVSRYVCGYVWRPVVSCMVLQVMGNATVQLSDFRPDLLPVSHCSRVTRYVFFVGKITLCRKKSST